MTLFETSHATVYQCFVVTVSVCCIFYKIYPHIARKLRFLYMQLVLNASIESDPVGVWPSCLKRACETGGIIIENFQEVHRNGERTICIAGSSMDACWPTWMWLRDMCQGQWTVACFPVKCHCVGVVSDSDLCRTAHSHQKLTNHSRPFCLTIWQCSY